MKRFKIGIMLDSLKLPTKEAVRKASEMGAEGLQIQVVEGDLIPEKLDAEARRDFLKLVKECGLEISALCGDLGGHGFQLPEENQYKISRSKEIVDLAVDLGVNVVTTHIGVVPEDSSAPTYQNELAVCRELGEYSAARGVTFAIETGPETAKCLASFLKDVNSKGIGVNLDPANLVMVKNDDPVAAVYTLRDYIVHTHAKDGINYRPCDALKIYGGAVTEDSANVKKEKSCEEVPLGEGSVDWPRYLAALTDIGYSGFLTIEREVGDNPVADIDTAIKFLNKLI